MNTAAATAVQAGHEQSIDVVEQVSNLEAVRLAHGIIHLWPSSTPLIPPAESLATGREESLV